MKKQILLLTLLLFGAVYFSSLNNGLSACDKNYQAGCVSAKKIAKPIAADYEEDEYEHLGPLKFPFVTL